MNNGIILIVNLQGKLGKKESNSSSRKIQRKIAASPYESAVLNKKGAISHYITPAKHFTATNNFKASEEQKCVRKTNISEDVVSGWVSGKAPHFVKDFIWKNMSKPQRLKAWVKRFDEGFGVSFQEL